MWLASTTTVTSLLLRRFNKSSVSSKSCRAALVHQTSFLTTATFNKFGNSSSPSSKFGTFILHDQQANNLHTTTFTSSPSSSKFGTIILQTYESSVNPGQYGYKKDDIIKMFMLSSSGSGEEEEEDKDDDDDQNKNKKKKKKKEKMVFKLDEDLGFSAICKDFQLQDSIRMVGSCNGIICLHDPELEWPLRDVYLWNPATREFKILPESTINLEEKRLSYKGNTLKDFVGFGFDVETKDYKVLRITPFVPDSYRGYGCMCRVQVYSLSTDSWRLLDGIDSLPLSPTQDLFGNRQGTYLNGSCFFLGSKPINRYGIRDLMLLSFDFTKEIFTIVELPDRERPMHKLVLKYWSGQEFDDVFKLDLKYWSKPGFDTSTRYCAIRDDLMYLGDKLAAFRTPRIDFAGGCVFTTPQVDLKGRYWCYKMWGFSEQKESESWTQLHEFRIKTKSSKHPCVKPRCVSNDREFALISTTSTNDNGMKKLMLFNLVTGKATRGFTIGDRDCRAAYVYKESQVSIMGGGNALLRWQLPTHGSTYKLNLYAPFTCSHLSFGIGLCLTSDTGGCIGVRSLKKRVSDAEEGEARAMFEAIKWAKELQLSPIIVESDSKNMVSFFMDDDDDNNSTYWNSKALSLLRKAKLLLKSSENSISFQYCSRSCNYVADIASKLGSDTMTSRPYKDWTANFPGEVVMSLSISLGKW